MLAVRPSTVPSLQPAVASASRAPSAKNAEVNLLSPFQPYQPWNNPCVPFSRIINQDFYGFTFYSSVRKFVCPLPARRAGRRRGQLGRSRASVSVPSPGARGP